MKIINIFCLFAILFALLAGVATAKDNPEVLVKAVEEATQAPPAPQETPEQRWQKFLEKKGWNEGLSNGGVIFIPERELIISSASAFTKVRLGQPGWVESRVVAFEKAEMEAKTKIIRYLAETVNTERSLSMLEHAVWSDDEVEKVKHLNQVGDTLKRIGKKSIELAEKKLDQALQKLDPEYDPAKYEDKTTEELQVIAEDMFNRQIKTVAMGTLIGVTSLYSTEEKMDNNEYQILVGVIWSPKLNRLAMSLFNDEYNIPPVRPVKKLSEHIPTEELSLLSIIGTRIVIDENGQYAIMAYGQAQPRRASPGRKQAVLHQAKQIAANRARAHLVNFIREGMTLRDSELSQELSRDFSDMTFGTQTVRDYQKKIKSKQVKIKLRGLRILKEWSFQHPATGQQVAGAVVAWSPASADQSKQAGATMNTRPKTGKKPKTTKRDIPTPSIESMPVDTSAY